jgi:IclR family transcriptional regulator, pca regulon regulatory protein
MIEDPTKSRLFNASLATGIEVLAAFGPESPEMGLTELAAAAGITKSAAQRYVFTFEALGLLRKNPSTKKLSLAPRTLGLGYRYLLTNSMLYRAIPYLLDLCRKSNETVNLAEPDDVDMVYVGRYETHEYMPGYMPIGSRLPIFCTATGRAYLSALPENEVFQILERSDRSKYTPNTVTDLNSLMETIAQARLDGFACAEGEYFRDDINVAAPVVDNQGAPIGAVNISAATARWDMSRMRKELAPPLLETARLISTPVAGRNSGDAFRTGFKSTSTLGPKKSG